jgi:hypothetical protein
MATGYVDDMEKLGVTVILLIFYHFYDFYKTKYILGVFKS